MSTPEPTPVRVVRPSYFWRSIVVFLCAASTFFCYSVLRKVERAIVVIENVDRKVDRVAQATAPLTSGALEHGRDAWQAIRDKNLNQLKKEEVESVKRLATDWLARQAKEKEQK